MNRRKTIANLAVTVGFLCVIAAAALWQPLIGLAVLGLVLVAVGVLVDF